MRCSVKILLQIAYISLFFFCIILLLETVCFYYILCIEKPLEKADLIIVFEGWERRVHKAYELIDKGYAHALLISPANKQRLSEYDIRYNPSIQFYKIIEEKARTTFENALYTQRILKDNNFRSVILVTSWHHMPRSYLLLKTMLIGSDIKIISHAVITGDLSRENWYQHLNGWKIVGNEMVELWGSFLEMLKYKATGEVFDTDPKEFEVLIKLKRYLLFKIKL